MKTPRELLLEHHQAAEARLDAIRREVLGAELGASRSCIEPRGEWLAAVWQQLFWSCRRTWAGLAAGWACIMILNTLGNGDQVAGPPRPKAASPEVMALLREQKHLRLELLGILPAERTRTAQAVPGPRSAREPDGKDKLDGPLSSLFIRTAEAT